MTDATIEVKAHVFNSNSVVYVLSLRFVTTGSIARRQFQVMIEVSACNCRLIEDCCHLSGISTDPQPWRAPLARTSIIGLTL
jgi:hypothetical protein